MRPSGRRMAARHERLREEYLTALQQTQTADTLTFNQRKATLKGMLL